MPDTPLHLLLIEGAFFIGIAPLILGFLRFVKARFQGRQGTRIEQLYLDLWKLAQRKPVVPASASWVFSAAPSIFFLSTFFLGFFTPILFVRHIAEVKPGMVALNWPLADLLVIAYMLSMGRFVMALAGMDSGSPFGGMGSGREMFMNFLSEPILIILFYALALNAHSSSLSQILEYHYRLGKGIWLVPAIWPALISLCPVTLIESGRIPIDNPSTHLELTMIGRAISLEYSGRDLALIEWAEAMRLTFFLTLLANLFLPQMLAQPDSPPLLIGLKMIGYLVKLFVLALILAVWELANSKMRLRAVIEPAGLALLLAILAVILTVLYRYTP